MQPYEKYLIGKKERRQKEMKKVYKRLLSVLLALVMVVGMIPVSGLTIVKAASSGTIYFDNSVANWSNVYVCTGSDFKTMTKDSTTGYYKYDFSNWDDNTNVIFTSHNEWNGDDGVKAADYRRTIQVSLSSVKDKVSKASGDGGTIDSRTVYSLVISDYTSGGGSTGGDTTKKRIYFDTRNYLPSGWANAYLYMWNADSSGTTVTMNPIDGKTGLFYYDVSSTYTNVIFRIRFL